MWKWRVKSWDNFLLEGISTKEDIESSFTLFQSHPVPLCRWTHFQCRSVEGIYTTMHPPTRFQILAGKWNMFVSIPFPNLHGGRGGGGMQHFSDVSPVQESLGVISSEITWNFTANCFSTYFLSVSDFEPILQNKISTICIRKEKVNRFKQKGEPFLYLFGKAWFNPGRNDSILNCLVNTQFIINQKKVHVFISK